MSNHSFETVLMYVGTERVLGSQLFLFNNMVLIYKFLSLKVYHGINMFFFSIWDNLWISKLLKPTLLKCIILFPYWCIIDAIWLNIWGILSLPILINIKLTILKPAPSSHNSHSAQKLLIIIFWHTDRNNMGLSFNGCL